jgi:aerobic-type carbon monoxide dehydrogenase small subunit (CoxS/CutS family)
MSCRPKLLEAARALFARTGQPTREEVDAVLVESMCLCTTYRPVLEAMLLTIRWRGEGVSG